MYTVYTTVNLILIQVAKLRKLNQMNRWNKSVKKLWSHEVTNEELKFVFDNFAERDDELDGLFISFDSLCAVVKYEYYHILNDPDRGHEFVLATVS